jgi:hypothetical protein
MRKLFVLLAAGMAVAGLLTATGSAAGASSHVSACASQPSKMGHFSGIVHAQAISGSACLGDGDGISTLGGDPPLIWHGGPAMGTDPNVPITITPIYWEPNSPNGSPLLYNNAGYRNLINQYLADVAAASGATDNVFSTATEYWGNNGAAAQNPIHYNIVLGAVIRDHDLLPKGQGCSVAKLDTTNIYSDGSGYSACLDDAQITAEIQNVVNGNFNGTVAGGHLTFPLQSDYNHEYVMLTPKHVASCFYPGSTANKKNVCTLTHYPSAGYCAYHSMFGPNYPFTGTVYANLPYPIYQSSVGFTCGSDGGGHGVIESPHYLGDQVQKDADVEVSPLSHEIMESITDPNVDNGWFDAIGNENGDDCAYVYGEGTGQGGDGSWADVPGAPGMHYNQTINGDNWLTQEEFSNTDWTNTGGAGGCVRGENLVTQAP